MKQWNYDVCILGGLGHVGLPLGISLAHEGLRVCLIDIDLQAMETVSSGKMPFKEEGAEDILRQVLGRNLFLTADQQAISESHFIVVTIGTPIDQHLNPEFLLFKEVFEKILPFIRDDQHIILRSTVFPGTTEKVKGYLENLGKKTRLSYCPERIEQGKAIQELRILPQIVSSFDEDSLAEVKSLFSLLVKDVIVLSPMEAELSKLYTNVWRYIQFSIANQFYQIASLNHLDFYKIYNAITYNYPRARNFPVAGFAAGPCLFKDTMQLASFSNNNFFLGHAAMLINEGLPMFIVQMLKQKYDLRQKTVGVLGMAFKADNDDKRESLSYKLKKILEIEAGRVLCSDVYIQGDGFVGAEEIVEKADIVIVGAPHREYAGLDVPEDKVLVDVWNFYKKGGGI